MNSDAKNPVDLIALKYAAREFRKAIWRNIGVAGRANLDKLAVILRPGTLFWILFCFLITIVAGLAQKILATWVEYVMKTEDQLFAQSLASRTLLPVRLV